MERAVTSTIIFFIGATVYVACALGGMPRHRWSLRLKQIAPAAAVVPLVAGASERNWPSVGIWTGITAASLVTLAVSTRTARRREQVTR
jgi:Na+-driven multidrug efflux pump